MKVFHLTLFLFLLLPSILLAKPGDKATSKCEEYKEVTRKLLPHTESIRRKRIVGGAEAKPHSFPFIAAIFYKMGPRDLFSCSGVLISPQFVLTASSCVLSESSKTVRFGLHRWNSSEPELVIPAHKVIMYPNKTEGSLEHDIGLIKLKEEVRFSRNIQPACLNAGELPGSGIIAGWGVTEYGDKGPGSPSDVLREANINIVPKDKCFKSYEDAGSPQKLGDGQFCALGSNGEDACIGDSGTPYFIAGDHDDLSTVAGIASYGKGCGKHPGVYTSTAKYIDWIENIVWP